MDIDHLFIFSRNQGQEAQDLIDFGWLEGSSRIHPGQGTVNRKFYFDNAYLELLWVHDEAELKAGPAADIQLWERSRFWQYEASPFGMCLENEPTSDGLFASAEAYQPDYFPAGKAIEILPNRETPFLPWTFRLPFQNDTATQQEPTAHPNGTKVLSKATFLIPEGAIPSPYVAAFESEAQIHFQAGPQAGMILEFDHRRQGKEATFEALSLTIRY